MELRQLRYLVDIVDEGSFTKAADKRHVAQPGVSAQIRSLERELGETLLDRSGGKVTATAVGAAVLPYARAALSSVADVRHTVDAMSGLLSGHLTIGTVASISTNSIDLPRLLASFHHHHERIEITLTETSSDELVEALRAGTLDIALLSPGAGLPEDLTSRTIATEPIAVAVAHDHPLAGKEMLPLAELQGTAVVTLPPGTGIRARLDAATTAAGIRLQVAFEVGDPRLLVQLAGLRLGAAIVPQSVVSAHQNIVKSIPLTQPTLEGHIALAWRAGKQLSPAAREFLAHAEQVMHANGRQS
jgi:DNA-binding transcriptional LysR family regulator